MTVSITYKHWRCVVSSTVPQSTARSRFSAQFCKLLRSHMEQTVTSTAPRDACSVYAHSGTGAHELARQASSRRYMPSAETRACAVTNWAICSDYPLRVTDTFLLFNDAVSFKKLCTVELCGFIRMLSWSISARQTVCRYLQSAGTRHNDTTYSNVIFHRI